MSIGSVPTFRERAGLEQSTVWKSFALVFFYIIRCNAPFKSVLLRGSPQGSWCVQCPQEGLVLGNVIQHFEVWLRTIKFKPIGHH